jgi:hypothetical protein
MADVPTYDASVVLTATIDRALPVSLVILTAAGFRLVGKTAVSAELTAPPATSARHNPLLGASRLRVSFQEGRLSVAAELGGVARLSRFVHVFPVVLALGLALTLGAIFTIAFEGAQASAARTATLAVLLAQVVIWAALGPLLARRIEARTRKAIDVFMVNVRLIAADS